MASLIGTLLGALIPTGVVFAIFRRMIAGRRRTGFLALLGVVLGSLLSTITCGVAAYCIVGHHEERNLEMWLGYVVGGGVWALVGTITLAITRRRASEVAPSRHRMGETSKQARSISTVTPRVSTIERQSMPPGHSAVVSQGLTQKPRAGSSGTYMAHSRLRVSCGSRRLVQSLRGPENLEQSDGEHKHAS